MRPFFEPLKRLSERVDGLALRERALIFGGVLAVLFAFASQALFPALQKEQKRLEAELHAKREQTRALYARIEQSARNYADDADARNRARIAELQARLRALEGTAAVQTRSLVSPREMPRLVKQVLTRNPALRLVELANLPPEPLVNPPPDTAAPHAKAGGRQQRRPAPRRRAAGRVGPLSPRHARARAGTLSRARRLSPIARVDAVESVLGRSEPALRTLSALRADSRGLYLGAGSSLDRHVTVSSCQAARRRLAGEAFRPATSHRVADRFIRDACRDGTLALRDKGLELARYL